MSDSQYNVEVQLTNEKVQFKGTSLTNRDNQPVIFDYLPPIGDGAGYTGLELLLMTLAGCSGTTVLVLLRSLKKDIKDLKVDAAGDRVEGPPLSFSQITLTFTIVSDNARDKDVEKAVLMAEETYCPVWGLLRNNVKVVTKYTIISP